VVNATSSEGFLVVVVARNSCFYFTSLRNFPKPHYALHCVRLFIYLSVPCNILLTERILLWSSNFIEILPTFRVPVMVTE